MIEENHLPTAHEFYLNTGLYKKFQPIEDSKVDLYSLVFYHDTIDCYCVECQSISVFRGEENYPKKPGYNGHPENMNSSEFWKIIKEDIYIPKYFQCVRNTEHRLFFYLSVSQNQLMKVGQYPSFADIENQKLTEYRKVLGNYYTDITKANGLFSHGIGIGAFVYLRRIIENFVIKPAYQAAKQEDTWVDEEYQGLRVKEKISKLESYLPPYIVEVPNIYSILSKGIHELGEEECLEYFPLVMESLENVLYDMKTKQEREAKRKNLRDSINTISGSHKRIS